MIRRKLFVYLFCIIIISVCLIAGCTSGKEKADPMGPAVIPETPVPVITQGMVKLTQHSLNLSTNEDAELHAGNLALDFSVGAKSRDPIKQTVNFELTVKNVGNVTVADLQKNLSDLFAVDRSGNRYNVPTHVALIGLKPGEIRRGTIEISNVPDNALPGLVFHYKFGNEEASWAIIPETPI
jgi:hypothetical protein